MNLFSSLFVRTLSDTKMTSTNAAIANIKNRYSIFIFALLIFTRLCPLLSAYRPGHLEEQHSNGRFQPPRVYTA